MIPRCIKCDAVMENCGGHLYNQPVGGTAFPTSGHYGSTVIDGGYVLEVNFCDPCLRTAIKRNLVWDSRVPRVKIVFK